MNNLLLFLLKSTLSLSLLYLAFSVLMRKETFFKLNRMVLLMMVFSSILIPFLYVPKPVQPRIHVNLEPIFQVSPTIEEPVSTTEIPPILQSDVPSPETMQPVLIPIRTIVTFVYLSGVLVSFLMFVYSIGSVLLLFSKARKTVRNGIRIRVVSHDIPAFSFGRSILISQHELDTNYDAIITHEQSHIRLGHFYDLMLMELVKIIFWFNPLVYRMVNDLKEIHEFQADDRTLNSGIDAKHYQILIIRKCVGHQKFALANRFNHCQIKNRIAMINKQKTSKARRWKVATFLPLLALLLIFCGRKSSNAPTDQGKKFNRLDITISGNKLFIKDTTLYAPSFINGLIEMAKIQTSFTLIDDSLIVRSMANTSPHSIVIKPLTSRYLIPTNLEINKEIVFSTKNKDKSFTLILKRTNYTNIEYQLKTDSETIKSGIAILGSSFYFGKEMDVDQNGKEIAREQYMDEDWTIIKVEIEHANNASVTYCVDQKAQKFETLSNFLRE